MPFPRIRRAAPALALLFLAAAPAVLPAQAALSALPSAPTAPSVLDAATRRSVVDSVAKVLEARYVDADVAKRLSARVRERLAAGAYDAETAPAAFGAALMRDLQSVVPDKHLRVSYEPSREFTLGPPRPPSGAPAGPVRWDGIDPRDVTEVARTNFAFDAVERLPGNVGYLKLSRFIVPAMARETAAAAMAFLANADAVVVDLRGNPGGSPEMVELILSYFFGPEPVPLLATYSRFLDTTVERRTLAEVPAAASPAPTCTSSPTGTAPPPPRPSPTPCSGSAAASWWERPPPGRGTAGPSCRWVRGWRSSSPSSRWSAGRGTRPPGSRPTCASPPTARSPSRTGPRWSAWPRATPRPG